MIMAAAVQAILPQQDALRADHARRIHRRRRADCDGRGRPGRERSRAQADREPWHQPAGDRPGRRPTWAAFAAGSGSASTLTVADAQAIRREAPAVGQVSYLIRQSGQVQYANQNWSTNIQGVSANYPPITNWQIAAGRGDFSATTRASAGARRRSSARLSSRQLFGANDNPIGAMIQVKGVPLRVIGIARSARANRPMDRSG